MHKKYMDYNETNIKKFMEDTNMSEQLNNEELVEVTTTQESILDKTKRFVQTHKTVLVTSGVVLAGLGITARLAWKKDSTSEPIEELFESEGKDLTDEVIEPIELDEPVDTMTEEA